MKIYFVRFFLLTVLVGFTSLSLAQSQTTAIKSTVERSLKEHFQKVSPPNSCRYNDAKFKYADSFKVTKKQQVGKTLRLWGIAAATYKNARTGGNGKVNFYAEVNKISGKVTVTKLRWQMGSCMKYETLYEL